MFNITRNFTVTGSESEVNRLGGYLVEMARSHSTNLFVVSIETFDDGSPYIESVHDENTVWTREVRVTGSRRAMRRFARWAKATITEGDLAVA